MSEGSTMPAVVSEDHPMTELHQRALVGLAAE
jgi:hypothetical protein